MNNVGSFKEKEFYKEKIVEMVDGIKSQDILNYIYIIICDITKENKDEKQK